MTDKTKEEVNVTFANGLAVAPVQVRGATESKNEVVNGTAFAFELVTGELLQVACAVSLKDVARLIKAASEQSECIRLDFTKVITP